MQKFIAIIILVGISGGVCYLLSQYEVKRVGEQIIISRQGQQANLSATQPVEASAAAALSAVVSSVDASLPPRDPNQKALCIASFNLEGFNSRKLAGMYIAKQLTTLLAGFDIVAVQDIRETHVGALRELVDAINASGRHFDFAVSPEVGSGSIDRFNAFLFNKATIELDRFKVFAVADTGGTMRCRPLVASFRARAPQASDAFTFMLVNVNVDYDQAASGLNLLDDVYRAVRARNPKEDDVILLGNFETDPKHPGPLAMIPNLGWAIDGIVSTVRGDRLADNLVFDRQATSEFTGRADVVDVVRSLNITSAEAARISGHLPVWAEFSVFEGGQTGHIAEKKTPETLVK